MKKITFILFALIAGTTFAQNTDNTTAPVKATIVAPIGITLESGTLLDFGTFTTGTADGTVIISADGTTRDFTQEDMEIVGYSSFSVPQFNITGDLAEGASTYNIVLAATDNPSDGATTDPVTLTLSNLTHSLTTNTGNNAASFTVGGTLAVPTTAGAGTYNGTITVTVKYD